MSGRAKRPPARARAIPRQGGFVFDEHRNTSRVWQIPPDALPNAQRALATLEPALRAWIEEGAPNLTQDEHVARFGVPYTATRSKTAARTPARMPELTTPSRGAS